MSDNNNNNNKAKIPDFDAEVEQFPSWMSLFPELMSVFGTVARIEQERSRKLAEAKWAWDNKLIIGPANWKEYEKTINDSIDAQVRALYKSVCPTMDELKSEGEALLKELYEPDSDDERDHDDDEEEDSKPAAKPSAKKQPEHWRGQMSFQICSTLGSRWPTNNPNTNRNHLIP